MSSDPTLPIHFNSSTPCHNPILMKDSVNGLCLWGRQSCSLISWSVQVFEGHGTHTFHASTLQISFAPYQILSTLFQQQFSRWSTRMLASIPGCNSQPPLNHYWTLVNMTKLLLPRVKFPHLTWKNHISTDLQVRKVHRCTWMRGAIGGFSNRWRIIVFVILSIRPFFNLQLYLSSGFQHSPLNHTSIAYNCSKSRQEKFLSSHSTAKP